MLKYLFIAEFSDGSVIQQTQEDRSVLDPIKSAFFDVLSHPAQLLKFGLVSDSHHISVDMMTGQFEINGLPFNVQDPSRSPIITPKRLIYFRRVQRHFKMSDLEPCGVNIVYHIGWQTTLENGENVQQTVSVE